MTPTLDDVHRAGELLRGVAHRTPVLTSRRLDERLGAQVHLKAEQLQRTGSFKLRGAYTRLASTDPASLARGVIAASSGNHAQGVAYAGRALGVPVTALMPADASESKVAAAHAYGARVERYDRFAQDPTVVLAERAERDGLEPVHAFDDPAVIAGQGTVALELLQQAPAIDLLVCCVGGGGLISGCATVAKQLGRGDVEVVGVQPAANDAVRRSWEAGSRVVLPVRPSIADGQQVRAPGAHTLPIVLAHVDRLVAVEEDAIRDAMRFLAQALKAVVEPSGASALAALLSGALDVRGRRVGVTLSGGNIEPRRYAAILQEDP